MNKRIFVCEWSFIGWGDISLGFHVCVGELYCDLHLPFGWLRIGWEREPVELPLNWKQCQRNSYGLNRSRRLVRTLLEKDDE